MEKQWKQWRDFILGGSKITADGDCSYEIKRHLLFGRKVMTNIDSILKSRDILPAKVRLVRAMIFPVVMYRCESWTIKKAECHNNWYLWTVVLEKTLESPLYCMEIQTVHPRGNLSWIFIGRTDAEAETPVLCPHDVKNWLIIKDPDAGKDCRQEEKGVTEDEMVRWHHGLDRRWVWASMGSWWWTGRPGELQFMGHRVRHNWLNWIELK